MKNGRLYPVGAIQTGEGILDLRVHPEGNFLYATRLNPLINISTFKIQSDGRAKASGDILTNSKPRNIGFSPLGKKVYITDVHKNNKILIFDFQLSGKLLDNGNFDIPGTKYTGKIAISPDGKKLFYADLRAGRILAYSLDKTKGYNKENELVSSGPPVNLIFDNEGNYLYILCSNNKIDIFKIDETGIKKSATVNTGKYPFEAVFHPGGKYFYVALRDENKIAAYAVSENGNLTEIGSFASGKYPVSLALAKVRK
jgi:DNA-binding beta-propeller fold protein YncE